MGIVGGKKKRRARIPRTVARIPARPAEPLDDKWNYALMYDLRAGTSSYKPCCPKQTPCWECGGPSGSMENSVL